jgi:hypothetical protein
LCQLLIEQRQVDFLVLAFEQAAGRRRLAHALEHHVHEQGFELAGRLLQTLFG